jgi:hypothetical protein
MGWLPLLTINDKRIERHRPKIDHDLRLAFGGGEEVELRAKSGKSLTRFFPTARSILRIGCKARRRDQTLELFGQFGLLLPWNS